MLIGIGPGKEALGADLVIWAGNSKVPSRRRAEARPSKAQAQGKDLIIQVYVWYWSKEFIQHGLKGRDRGLHKYSRL